MKLDKWVTCNNFFYKKYICLTPFFNDQANTNAKNNDQANTNAKNK